MKLIERIKLRPELGLVTLAFVAFIALGMPDGLLGVAWPSIRAGFSIPIDAIGALLAASVAGYMTASSLSGPLIARLGIGRVLAASCALTGAAMIGDTLVPQWWMMVLLGVAAGLGAGAIDAGLNTYVAAHFGERLMQWLHASYGIGVTLGPLIMTIALAGTHSWRPGHRLVGSFQLLLAVCFVLTLSWWANKGSTTADGEKRRLTDYRTPLAATLRQPRVWLSMLLFVLYVGAEASLGTWTYSLLVESRGIESTRAGLWAGSYWATFTIGRVLAGVNARKVGGNALVLGGLGAALLGVTLLIWNPTAVANLVAVALIGLGIAPIFPALMSGTAQRVDARFAANTIGMQMSAAGLAAAVVPSLLGILARRYSLEVIPLCLAALFLGLLASYRWSTRPRPPSSVVV